MESGEGKWDVSVVVGSGGFGKIWGNSSSKVLGLMDVVESAAGDCSAERVHQV